MTNPHPGHAASALATIEGERLVLTFLDRLRAEQDRPGDLALLLAPLYGAKLQGACAAITKLLRQAPRP